MGNVLLTEKPFFASIVHRDLLHVRSYLLEGKATLAL